MKFSYAAITAVLASVAYSQSINDVVASIPSCALTCLLPAITSAGCGAADYACQCGSAKDEITKAATPCIAAACSASDTLNPEVQSATTQICTLEAASGSGSSSSASASDSSSSAAPSTTAAGTTSAPSSSSSSGSFLTSATGSSIGSLTSAASSKASSASSAASSAGASATSSAPATVSTNASNRVVAAGAVVGAGFLAAFAL
ncbi:CFEM domain-containing protein [Rutstroemia sp. NJR-2017a BBW]|nr:CFEM domain-containing protein [Rutstroemia sp. NJR-2017a BBW]